MTPKELKYPDVKPIVSPANQKAQSLLMRTGNTLEDSEGWKLQNKKNGMNKARKATGMTKYLGRGYKKTKFEIFRGVCTWKRVPEITR